MIATPLAEQWVGQRKFGALRLAGSSWGVRLRDLSMRVPIDLQHASHYQ